MIANAKAVAHGIRAMLYVSGESRNKKHPEKITRICDNFMPQGMDATGIWTEMKFATMNHPNIKNNVIRMEISPAMEHTEDFTLEDWRQLWYDFAKAFDEQEIRDKDGKVVSGKTNVSGSKSSVWLHEESKSGIPHLHAIVCRVDEDGKINNDHAIHLRAQRAAEKVARQRGWTTAMHIHETNIPQVSADCMEALRELGEWSWDGYKERLAAKGYDLYLRKDKKDVIRGYVLVKGPARFKASELGKGRSLTASRIRRTWEKLHPESRQRQQPAPRQPVVRTEDNQVSHGQWQNRQSGVSHPQPIREDYSTRRDGCVRTEITHGGGTYQRYLPSKVTDFFDNEFDYRETVNWQDLQNLAMAYFTLITSPYEVTSGGGGGSQSDLPWGRDPKEDEIDFARRCARMAASKMGIQKKSGRKR